MKYKMAIKIIQGLNVSLKVKGLENCLFSLSWRRRAKVGFIVQCRLLDGTRRFGGARITFHREASKGVTLKFCWTMLGLELRWGLQLLKLFKC